MNIEKLCRQSLQFLKDSYPNFPKSGFIAGGSLANVIWERVSGNKAIINDIDVFIFQNKIDKVDGNYYIEGKNKTKLFYHKKEVSHHSDYRGLLYSIEKSKNFYFIESTEQEQIYNFINYSSNNKDPKIILDSFDINCTQVGYSIEEDKFYYTTDFVDFLKTGELKLTTLSSPGHSAIRLVKKKHELSAKLDQLELKLCQYAIYYHLSDVTKTFFTDKYYSTFQKFKSEYEPYFVVEKSQEVSDLLLESKGIQLHIYRLVPAADLNIDKIKTEERISHFTNGESLLFYIRNIRDNSKKLEVWNNLEYLYKTTDYLDCEYSTEDIDLLKRLTNIFPETIKNLIGLKLSEQIIIVKKLLNIWKDDPIVAISVLEKHKFEPNFDLEDLDLLLLELSVRKAIVIDNSDKIEKVLNPEKYKLYLNNQFSF